jgi:hypothetical protein
MFFSFGLWHLFILLPFIALYFVPTIIAVARKPPYLTAVVVVNFFLGWTFIGWIVALVLAAQSSTKAPPPLEPWRTPAQQPPGWPPAPASPAGWQPPPASPSGWQPAPPQQPPWPPGEHPGGTQPGGWPQ